MLGMDATARSALLLRLAGQVTARHDLDDVLSETFRCLRPLVAFAGGSIQLVDDEGWIQMVAADPVAPEHVLAQRVPLGTSVAGRIVLTEQPVYLPDIEVETLPLQRRKSVAHGVRSYLGVPLVADGRAIGLLQVDSTEPDAWTPEQRELILAVAPIVAAAIQNARAHAREAASRSHAQATARRLAEARQLVTSVRGAYRRGEHLDVERLLARLEVVVNEPADIATVRAQVPQQKGNQRLSVAAGT
jgi:GAF domain-containing protein